MKKIVIDWFFRKNRHFRGDPNAGKNYGWLVEITTLLILVFETINVNANTIKSEAEIVKTQILTFDLALQNFKDDTGRFPSTEEGIVVLLWQDHRSGWKGPYLKKFNDKDIWGTKYKYICPSKYGNGDYDLYSYGLNRRDDHGKEDDITNFSNINSKYYNVLHNTPLIESIWIVWAIIFIIISSIYLLWVRFR